MSTTELHYDQETKSNNAFEKSKYKQNLLKSMFKELKCCIIDGIQWNSSLEIFLFTSLSL